MKRFTFFFLALAFGTVLLAQNIRINRLHPIGGSNDKYQIGWTYEGVEDVEDIEAIRLMQIISGKKTTIIFEGTPEDSIITITIPEDSVYYYAVVFLIKGAAGYTMVTGKEVAASNILLNDTSFVYDACSDKLTVKWNHFNGWVSNKLIYYYAKYPSGEFIERSQVGQNFFVLDSKKLNEKLKNGKLSLQIQPCYDKECIEVNSNEFTFTKPPTTKRPAFIEATGTQSFQLPIGAVWSAEAINAAKYSNTLMLNFQLDEVEDYSKYNYIIYRSDSITGTYLPLYPENVNLVLNSKYIENEIVADYNLRDSVKYYKASIYDPECKMEIVTSNIESNIVLNIMVGKDPNTGVSANILEWSSYNYFLGDNREYTVVKVLPNSPQENIGTTKSTTFKHAITKVDGWNIDSVCYYVEVNKEANSGPNPNISGRTRSNLVCVPLPPQQLAKVLVLKNDCKAEGNEGFPFLPNVKSELKPTDYYLVIYDRWGTKVFESTDYTVDWKGQKSMGGIVSQGVYVYYLKYTNLANVSKTIQGSLTVLCGH